MNIKKFTTEQLLYFRTPLLRSDDWNASDQNFLINTICWIIQKAVVHDPRDILDILRCKTLISEK